MSIDGGQFVADIENWLRTRPATPDEARRQAWAKVADACECALVTEGLSASDANTMAITYRRASRDAGRDPLDLIEPTAAQLERSRWYEDHGYRAHEDGGVLVWDALHHEIRSILYGERIMTVAEVRTVAADHGLQAIDGIGPARARAIMDALTQTPA